MKQMIAGWALILLAAPAMAETPLGVFHKAMEDGLDYRAVWEGTFRRYDGDGALTAEFPSRIVATFNPSAALPYRQTNTYRLPDGTVEEITSEGAWEDGRLVFTNPRVDGYSADLTAAQDPSQRSGVLHLSFKDGSGLAMYEIITMSADGMSRSRMAQYLIGGKVVRRTLIDEVKAEETFTPLD